LDWTRINCCLCEMKINEICILAVVTQDFVQRPDLACDLCPQAVLGVLSGLKGPCFFQTCYQVLGEMLDLLALFNGAVNFLLYCAMSRQFRATFCNLFLPWLVQAEAPPPPGTTAVQAPVPSEVNSTVV
jgi:hypothetical protein